MAWPAVFGGIAAIAYLGWPGEIERPEIPLSAAEYVASPGPVVRAKQARAPAAEPLIEEASIPPVETSEDQSSVWVSGGRMSVRVEGRPLTWLLEQISREAGVAILPSPGADEQRVSVAFEDLALDDGLRRILEPLDAFYYYRGGLLRVVWVYPWDEGRGLQPVPPEDWASTTELEDRIYDPDPGERARAVQALVERRGIRASDVVLGALSDEDDWVRTQALYGASRAGVELPSQTLSDLAVNDPSENVRFLALEALAIAEDPWLEAIAVRALEDPSPHLRNKAREILGRLEPVTPTPAPLQAVLQQGGAQ
jgi:hypothetical protein